MVKIPGENRIIKLEVNIGTFMVYQNNKVQTMFIPDSSLSSGDIPINYFNKVREVVIVKASDLIDNAQYYNLAEKELQLKLYNKFTYFFELSEHLLAYLD